MEKNKQINFNKQLYSRAALEAAVLAFSDLAKFTFLEDEKYFQVEFEEIDEDVVDSIVDEFANYVLAKMKE